MKRFAVIFLFVAIALMGIMASGTKEASDGLSGTLTFTIWDNNLNDFIEKNDMVGKYIDKLIHFTEDEEKNQETSGTLTMEMLRNAGF